MKMQSRDGQIVEVEEAEDNLFGDKMVVLLEDYTFIAKGGPERGQKITWKAGKVVHRSLFQ